MSSTNMDMRRKDDALFFDTLFPDDAFLPPFKAEPSSSSSSSSSSFSSSSSSSAAPSFLKPSDTADADVEMRAALALDLTDWHHDPLADEPEDEDVDDAASTASTAAASVSSPSPSSSSTSSSSAVPRVPAEVLAHMPLPPRSEHVDQRERNRLIVKRCYYKKISTLNELRTELERVDGEYQALLAHKHAAALRPTTAAELAAQTTRAQQLHAKYVELTLLADTLQRENGELRRVETEYLKMEKQMVTLRLAQSKHQQQQLAAQELKRRNPIVELQPLTAAECRAIALAAFAKITDFRESKNIFTTGANIFGWRDRHCVKNDKLMFLLEKAFADRSAQHIADSVWALLSKADTLADTYSPHLDVLYHEVQRVDEDHVVFYHTLERPDAPDLRIKALMLASRVCLGPQQGWLIVFRGLDPKKYLIREGEPPRPRDRRGRNKIEPQKEDIWIDTFVWGLFRPDASGVGCLDDFGGIVDGTELISASVWMIEMLQFVVRCETKVVGPQLVLSM